MSAQEMVTVDEARHALRAYEVTDNSSTGAANAYRTVIALHARVAELESHRDHYTREAARLVAVEAGRNTLRAERDAAEARVAELEAQVARLIRLSETEAAATNANAADDYARILALEAKRDALRAERDAAVARVAELAAIVEGRATPPTRAEIDAHAANGGGWMIGSAHGGVVGAYVALDAEKVEAKAANWRVAKPVEARFAPCWWPLDRHGRPCAWPKVTP